VATNSPKQDADSAIEIHFFAMMLQQWEAKYAVLIRAIEPDYLVSPDCYPWLTKKMQEWLETNDRPIPWEWLAVQLNVEFNTDPDMLEKMRGKVYALYTIQITWGPQALNDFRQHLAWRVYSGEFRASQEGYQRSRSMALTLDQGRRGILKATSLLMSGEVHDVMEEYDVAKSMWTLERDNPGLRKRIELGIPELDPFLRFEEGTVNAVMGVFKAGKSIVLNHVGLCGLAHGYNVAHIIYENTVELTRNRYFARIMDLPYDSLIKMRPEMDDPAAWAKKEEQLQELRSKLDNRLKIFEATPNVTTVADIESQLEVLRAERGWEPDVVVWDYLNITGIEKSRREREERLNQATIIWDLQAHAKDKKNGGARKKIVVTAIQAKGEAVKKKEALDAGDYGKSIGIPQALDGLIGVKRTDQDVLDKRVRFSLLVSRASKAVPEIILECDYEKMCVANSSLDWMRGKFQDLLMGLL
jgi:hypothetical protein